MREEKIGAQSRTINPNTIKRLLSYLKNYKLKFTLVIIMLFINAFVSVSFSIFFKVLIDDYITPLALQMNPSFTAMFMEIVKMAVIALIGIFANWGYNRIMAQVSQGILKTIRDEMFTHMQKLPISFFDTNTTGEVMSLYTNDTDTLRQMLNQSIPQMISSVITIITVSIAMIVIKIPLTIFVAL